jgi:hypothetical protein
MHTNGLFHGFKSLPGTGKSNPRRNEIQTQVTPLAFFSVTDFTS